MKLPPNLRSSTYACVKCGKELTIPQAPSDEKRAAAASKRIGKILIEEDLITREQLQEALEVQRASGGRTFEILISLGHLDREALHACLSRQQGVAGIDLKNYHVPKELLSLIPGEFACEHVLLPIDKLGRLLTIGMACPLDDASIAQVEKITGLTVKPMLCKLDDIHAALKRYYPAAKPDEEAGAEADDGGAGVLARIARIDALPGRIATVQQVLNIVEDDESAVQSAADLVAADPCLTAQLLSVANQPAYGMTSRVMTPQLAVALLGLDGTLKVVLNASKAGAGPSVNLDMLWPRSLFAAVAAQKLAREASYPAPAAAYTAGLLLHIGCFALAHLDGAAYASAAQLSSSKDVMAAERKLFGVAYPETGGALLRSWGIPEEIADAVALHASKEAAAAPLTAIAALAGCMAEAFSLQEASGEEAKFTPPKPLLSALGISVKSAQVVFAETMTEAG